MTRLYHFILLMLCVTLCVGFLARGTYLLFTTTAGANLIISIATKWLPGNITIKEMTGQLSNEMTLKNITYRSKERDIDIGVLVLNWNPQALLQKQIDINKVILSHVTIREHAELNKKSNNSRYDLPSFLYFTKIAAVQIKDVKLIKPTYPAIDLDLFFAYNNGNVTNLTAALNAADTTLTLSGDIDTAWDVKWRATIPNINKLIANYRGHFTSQGTISGPLLTPFFKASFQGKELAAEKGLIKELGGTVKAEFANKPYPRAIVDIKATRLTFDQHVIPSAHFTVVSTLQKNYLNVDVRGLVNQTNKLNGSLQLPVESYRFRMDKSLKGKVVLLINNIEKLPIHLPESTILKGKLASEIDLMGTLINPVFKLSTRLTQGSVGINYLGITLNNINLESRDSSMNLLAFDGSFTSGKGLAKVKGMLDLNKKPFALTLNLTGNDLLVANLKTYKIMASPDIHINYQQENLALSGKVSIPFAKITPSETNTITSLPADVVFVNKKNNQRDFLNNVSTAILVSLTKPISIHYESLSTMLTGKLFLNKNKDGPFTASGLLYTLDGTYTFYGKAFNIEEGRLTYAGNLLTNPGLAIRATKKIQIISTGGSSPLLESDVTHPVYTGSTNLTVGVSVNGTFDNPIISFFADKGDLSQKDILSYLLFGYPSSNISSGGSMMLLNDALMNAKNGRGMGITSITSNIQEKLQLNELGVKTLQYYNPETNTTENTTAVTIGKSFGERFSLNYTRGIFQSISAFTARFNLTKQLAIQAESNVLENGVDLLYEIE